MEKKYRDPWAARHDHQKVDLAFIVDCTASMGPYINQTQKNIRNITDQISKQAFNVKMALIEYRDHPPEDSSFITRVNDFTHSVDDMKKWVDGMKASGGGDSPEAVADALGAALQLNYRVDSTKICVLIADAPPHGLDQTGDGFPEGCPQGLDPLVCCQKMAEKGITLYFVGCEPSVLKYKDFYSGLALKTGGQYVPLQNPGALSKVVISATLEEVSLEKLMGYVDDFINLELRQKRHKTENRNVKSIKVDDLAHELQKRLQITNTTCEQLQLNQESLGCASHMARKVSRTKNVAEARKLLISHLSMPVDYSVKSKDAEFTNAQSVFVSPAQSERLILKSLARNKIPVTHDEKLGMIIVPDTVNVPVEL